MGKVRHVDYSPDEYISGVGAVLTAAEQGIYWMICSLIMSSGGPILRDERRIGSLCRTRPADVGRIVDRLVALGKIETDGTKLGQKRAQSEVERSATRIQIATENGAKGGRPAEKDKEIQREAEAAGLSAANLSLTSNEQRSSLEVGSKEPTLDSPKRSKARRHAYSEKFEHQFWKVYPTDPLMSKRQAGEAFERLSPELQDEVIASLPAFRAHCSSHVDYRPVHAVRYITQGRYEGFLASSKTLSNRVFVAVGSPVWTEILRRRGLGSMPHTEHDGKRGWFFDRAEVQQATVERQATAA